MYTFRANLRMEPVIEKIRRARRSWYGHVISRDERQVIKRVIQIVDEYNLKRDEWI